MPNRIFTATILVLLILLNSLLSTTHGETRPQLKRKGENQNKIIIDFNAQLLPFVAHKFPNIEGSVREDDLPQSYTDAIPAVIPIDLSVAPNIRIFDKSKDAERPKLKIENDNLEPKFININVAFVPVLENNIKVKNPANYIEVIDSFPNQTESQAKDSFLVSLSKTLSVLKPPFKLVSPDFGDLFISTPTALEEVARKLAPSKGVAIQYAYRFRDPQLGQGLGWHFARSEKDSVRGIKQLFAFIRIKPEVVAIEVHYSLIASWNKKIDRHTDKTWYSTYELQAPSQVKPVLLKMPSLLEVKTVSTTPDSH